MNDKDKLLISELFEKQLGNKLSKEEAELLEKTVLGSQEAQDFYFDLSVQNAGLEENANDLAGHYKTPDIKTPIPIIYLKIAVSASLIIGLLLGLWMKGSKEKHIATLTHVDHCKWAEGTLATAKDSHLTAGTLRLEQGVAHIRFSSGVQIQLEAPTHIELVNNMKCIVHKGTVMADVPDQAKGFTINTPTANVIDHGTRFLVSYNPQNKAQQSYIEVLEGEVEVLGKSMKKSTHFKKGDRVLADNSSLKEMKEGEVYSLDTPQEINSTKTISIFSQKEYELIRGNAIQQNYNSKIIMVKNSTCNWARKGYIQFNINKIIKTDIKSVALNINMLETGIGFACYVGDSTFDIYALNDGQKESWEKPDMKWLKAPAATEDAGQVNPSEAKLIGSFSLPKGVYTKSVTITSKELQDFIKKDTNQLLTFIVVRRTAETERYGLAHGFASSKNETALPPKLVFEYK